MADIVTLPLLLDAIIILLILVLAVLVYRRLVSQSHATPQPVPYASPTLSEVSLEEHVLKLLEERHALKSEELSVRRKQAVGIYSGHQATSAIRPIHARLKEIEAELVRTGVL